MLIIGTLNSTLEGHGERLTKPAPIGSHSGHNFLAHAPVRKAAQGSV